MTHPTTDTIESLTAELQSFCEREGLPQQCAEELLVGQTLTVDQSYWLISFSRRWDAINQPQAPSGFEQ
jgi:hypothetical protein